MGVEPASAPNHHAHYPAFAGFRGLIAAVTMLVGGGSDARLAERLSGLRARETLVDVGCGPGTAVRHAAHLGASAVGVDPAPVMLRVARIVTRRSDRVRYMKGKAEALPLPDASMSVLWSIACVHHWDDLDGGLCEARRVLVPGGRLVAIERRTLPGAQGLASHGWTDQQAAAFADRCLAHGFKDLRSDRHDDGRRSTVSVTATAGTRGNPTDAER